MLRSIQKESLVRKWWFLVGMVLVTGLLSYRVYSWWTYRVPTLDFDKALTMRGPEAQEYMEARTNWYGAAHIHGKPCELVGCVPHGRGCGGTDHYFRNLGNEDAWVWRSYDGEFFAYGRVQCSYFDWTTHTWKIVGEYNNQSFRCPVPTTNAPKL